MADATHVTSDGRRELFLKVAADAAACEATPGTFYHTGSTLHVNSPTASGVIVVRYRPVTDVLVFRLSGQNIRVIGAGPSACGFLYPLYKSSGVACYAIQMLGSTSTHTGYTVRGIRFDGSWHAIGVLSTPSNGSLEFDDIDISNCEFNSEVIGDHAATLSYNPIVVYSGNTTGVMGTPVYLDITNWFTYDCVFNCYRPVYTDGTSFSNTTDVFGNAIAGGTTGNNQANLLFSHGGNAYCLPRIYGGATVRNCEFNLWDYEALGTYFCQRTYQAYTDAAHDDEAWDSWMEDCVIRSRLTYDAAYAALRYGVNTFSAECNVRLKRVTWVFPDRMVYSATGGTAAVPISSGNYTTANWEFEECKIVLPTNAATLSSHWLRVFQIGSTNATTAVFRARHCTFVHNQATMPADIVWFDLQGASLVAKLQVRGSIFHAVDNGNHVLIYDCTAGQLPLYSTDPTALVMENNFYSNVTTGKYDLSLTARDTQAEWSANSGDGPHDGTLGNGAGRDARYTTAAGTFDNATLLFGETDLARTAKIDASVTLASAPTIGLNGRPFDRHFGADQFGGGGGTANLIMKLLGVA